MTLSVLSRWRVRKAAAQNAGMDAPPDSVASMLLQAQGADPTSPELLFATLYSELHRLARREARRYGPGAVLGTTTLLHEAYLDMSQREALVFPDRARFLSYAGRAMRRIVIDRVRERNAQKRGGGLDIPSLDTQTADACEQPEFLQDIGDALDELAALEPELATVVDLKFFCGFTMAGGAALSVPSRVECLMGRSFIESALGHFDAGIVMSRESLRALEAAGVRDGEQHRIVRSAMSRALMLSGRNAEAMALAAPVLAESEAGQGRESMAAIRRSGFVTSLKRAGGQPLAALPLSDADEASALHLLGAAGRDAITDLEHGRVLLALGRYAEASSVLLRAASVGRETQSRRALLPAELAAVEALLQAGRTAQARAVFAAAEPGRVAALRDGRPAQIDVLRIEALLAMASGDAAASARALDLARAKLDTSGGDAHPGAYGVALARAEAALAAGRVEPALAECERALGAAQRSALDAARSSDIGTALGLRSRIRLAAGRRTEALSDAGAALAQLEATLGASHPETRAAARVQASAR